MIKHDPTNARHRSWPILAPQDLEIAGLNFIQFSSSCSVFRIKVDSRPFPEEGLATVVGGGPDLAVLKRAYSPSPYFSLTKKPWPKPPLHRKYFPEMMSINPRDNLSPPAPMHRRKIVHPQYSSSLMINPINQDSISVRDRRPFGGSRYKSVQDQVPCYLRRGCIPMG